VLEAIEIARSSGRDLVIAGGRYDEPYAEQVDRAAAVRDGVTLAGPVVRTEIWRLMARSAALLFPILWEEPFGMVTAEAQAAGCPVIGFRGGALADVVQDGVTGAVVERGNVEAARAAVSSVARYDRRDCRRHAERSLDIEPAIRAHVALYEAVAGRGSPSSPVPVAQR
jgi:glycosyltransferase involved in cell wall biosynthesis